MFTLCVSSSLQLTMKACFHLKYKTVKLGVHYNQFCCMAGFRKTSIPFMSLYVQFMSGDPQVPPAVSARLLSMFNQLGKLSLCNICHRKTRQ